MAGHDDTPSRGYKPSNAEVTEAQAAIRRGLSRECDVDDIAQDAIAEACKTYDPTKLAAFASFAVLVARRRAIDRARKARREKLTSPHELREPEQGASRPRLPPVSTQEARTLERVLGHIAANVEGLLWPGADGPERVAQHLRRMMPHYLGRLAGDRPPRATPLDVPKHFERALVAFIRAAADTGEGHWVESDQHEPPRRRGRASRAETYWTAARERAKGAPPVDPHTLSPEAAYWDEQRTRLFGAVAAYALALCGLRRAEQNRTLSPLRAADDAERRRTVRLASSARVRLGLTALRVTPRECDQCGEALSGPGACPTCLAAIERECGFAGPSDWPREN